TNEQTSSVSSAKVNLVPSYAKSRMLILNKWRQSTISRSEVVLIQSEIKARAHQISRRCGVIPENLFDNSMQRSGVGSLIEVNPTTKYPCMNIVWFEGNEAI